jgi:LmbE family N-acetylglucosaminyl deacetylase
MKILCIHAHYDDYEFVAAGTFQLWKQKLGHDLTAKVVVCTDGAAGHHFRSREETARLRLQEQMASAKLGGYQFEQLKLPDGRVSREACLQSAPGLLAALWKTIRSFEPDYLFCPPLATDPVVGVHVDHLDVAEAIRKVAYLINVPHVFTPEYPSEESRPCKVPVIINVNDPYMGDSLPYDLAVDVDPVFDQVAAMAYCHQSQIMEWLPWINNNNKDVPKSLTDWTTQLRWRSVRRNAALGLNNSSPMEFFTVTAWGAVPRLEQLIQDIPGIVSDQQRLDRLGKRLARWGAAAL